MSTVRLEAVGRRNDDMEQPGSEREIPMQPASQDIWDKKYRLKTKSGVAVDADIDGTYQRVAKALSGAEADAEQQKLWNERSEEHTSELQSLMRISYAVFCLKKKNKKKNNDYTVRWTEIVCN